MATLARPADPTREIAVGLAGLGRFGKLHAAVLAGLPGARLAAVCDSRPDEVAAVGERYDVPERDRSTDFVTMLDRTRLDAVAIVTPEPLHLPMILAAAERRLPIFVEKPLATTADDAARAAEVAVRAGVYLQVGLVLRFDIHHAALKEQIAAGGFGDLVSLRAKRNVSRAWFAGFGGFAHPVYETSIHDLDLMLWYAQSPVTTVYARQRNLSGLLNPDACWALLTFASGAIGIVETSWCLPAAAPANVLAPTWHGTIDAEFEVVGTERTGQLRLLESGLQIWSDHLVAHPEAALWPELHGRAGGALREEIVHFIERVRTGTPSPVASVADAVAGLRVADAIIAAAAEGREIVL